MMDIITSIAQIVFAGAMMTAPVVIWFIGIVTDVLGATLDRNNAKPDKWFSSMHFAGLVTQWAAVIMLFRVYGTQATVFSYFSGAAVVYAVALAVVNAVKEIVRTGGSTIHPVVEEQL